jgi:exonuclease III
MPRRSWRDDEEKAVSPPPLKRRKLPDVQTGPTPVDSNVSSADITIYSWNINGIGPFVQQEITSFFKPNDHGGSRTNATADSNNLRDVLRRYQWPTMLLLQEVKINPADASTQRAIQRLLRTTQINTGSDEPSYVAHFCLPSDPHNARGFGRKIYGVCSIVREDFYEQEVARMREVSWDAEGRFLICETNGSNGLPKLAVINIYAVNGTDLPYKDSKTGEVVGTRHVRKLEVHRLLQGECRMLEDQGFAVVLAGDINIARTSLDGHPNLRTKPPQHCLNRADFEARFFKEADTARSERGAKAAVAEPSVTGRCLGMIDTFRRLHRTRKGYTYYPRGVAFGSSCDRVDMILISKAIEKSLVEADIKQTPADRGPSDHVPLFAVLRFDKKPESTAF